MSPARRTGRGRAPRQGAVEAERRRNIYAEVSIAYKKIEDIELALPPLTFRREALPYEAAFLAGKAFMRYKQRGGRSKVRPLPDFYIGAHAAVAGYRLLTRDAACYRTYFPGLHVVAPE